MNKYEKLALMALSQLRAVGANFPPDTKEEAVEYAKSAVSHLRGVSTYDPFIYATALADDAIVEYVKAKIMGQPTFGQTPFNIAANVWTKRAADEYRLVNA